MALDLMVSDREGTVYGRVQARVGMLTQAGRISRMTEKTIWCVGKSGHENMYRHCDGRLPSVSPNRAGKAIVPFDKRS